jgi:hypothetical protein
MTINFVRVIRDRRARNRQIARDKEITENMLRIAEVFIRLSQQGYTPYQKESA